MSTAQRYLSLDVFRGFTIAAMITVNNPGSWSHIYAPLRHSAWHGCTPTDLVFPFFLFIVGVSMYFSFIKYGSTINKASLLRIGRRTLLIFAIGLFLNSFPQWMADFSHLRIMGVLQRIALAYGIGSLIVLAVKRSYLPMVVTAILVLYWAVLYFYGGPDPYSLSDNTTIPFDTAIIGKSHLYKGFGIPFDPEGLLSTIPALGTVILGYLAGGLIKRSDSSKLPLRLILAGIAGIGSGLILSFFMPINKPLWTSSYVLYTAGWACVVLACLVWVIDLKGNHRWTIIFTVFGMNSLFIFALSGLWAKCLSRLISVTRSDGTVVNGNTWLYQEIFVPLAGNLNGSLLYALTHILVFWILCYVLYRKKIFIKV